MCVCTACAAAVGAATAAPAKPAAKPCGLPALKARAVASARFLASLFV
jgi:hypothetical protein